MEVEYAPTDEEIAEQEAAEARAAGEPPAPDGSALMLSFAPPERSYSEEVLAPLVPPIAIGGIVFAIVGLIIWAGLRMTNAASTRNRYGQAVNREMAYQPDPDPLTGAAAAALPAPAGFGLPMNYTSRRTAAAPAPAPIDRALVTGPFLGDENRKAAKASLQPIHGLVALIRKYDSKGLWGETSISGLPIASNSVVTEGNTGNGSAPLAPTSVSLPTGGVAPVMLPAMAPSPSVPLGNNAAYSGTRGATFQGGSPASTGTSAAATERMGETIERIHNNAESLATQVNMTTVPEQYPEPLRADIKTVSQELYAYLKDADIAATQDSATQTALRRRAAVRLSNAEQMLTYMNGVIDGTSDANKPPRFAVQTQ